MAKHWDEPHLKCRDTEGDVYNCYGEEEEALSLSDLPLELEQDARLLPQEDEENSRDASHFDSESEFEFGIGFGSWLGSMSTQPLPEMCAAEDLFFQGRILPLRRDDSADRSFTKKSVDETNSFTKGPASRSDSVGSGLMSRVTSTSSRSSSKGSQHSSSGSTTSTSASFGSSPVAHSFASNRFSSCRSPGPQTGFPGSNKPVLLQANKIRSKSQRNSSSSASMWEFFRTGLVRTPDIELHNPKTTRANDNNNSCDSNNKEEQEKGKKKKKKGIAFGILGGCKCTADSVATNLVLLRSDSSRIRNRRKSNAGSGEEEELRRKLMELIEIDDSRTRKSKKGEARVEKHRDRLTPSWSRHRRTFEWVKELPHSAAGGYYVLHQH